MPNATINYDNDMIGWPPKTYLIELDEPMVRYDPETGEPESFTWIALCCKDSEPKESYVFPTDENGHHVDPSLTPMRKRDYGLPHAVLSQLGYTLTN